MAAGEVGIGQVARDSVEDAGPGRGVVHAEVVAVEDVVSGHVVEAAGGVFVTVGQYAADDEIDDQPPDCRRNSATDMICPGSFAFLTTGCWL